MFISLLQLALPPILFALVILAPFRNGWPLLLLLVLATLGAAFAWMTTTWFLYSYWLLIPLVALLIAAWIVGIRKMKAATWTRPSLLHSLATLLFAGLSFWLMALIVPATRNIVPQERPLALAFPFDDGAYAIRQGGAGPPLQISHRYAQANAIDIVKIGFDGMSNSWGDPTSKGRISGQPVLAPCEGAVVRARDGEPDIYGPEKVRYYGNFVAIECSGDLVYLAHLTQGSVAVEEGDIVQVGQPIGTVGLSGNTRVHHLHMHVERGELREESYTQNEPVPMTFDGASPWRHRILFR